MIGFMMLRISAVAAIAINPPFMMPMSRKSPAQGSSILSAKADNRNNKRHPRRSADAFRSPTPGEGAVTGSTTVIIHGTGGICNKKGEHMSEKICLALIAGAVWLGTIYLLLQGAL